jgi:1-acyl-sn-glycerol-3-phosphate acyltransferase
LSDVVIRLAKGLLMGLMYAVWFVALPAGLVACPVYFALDKRRGPDPTRFQKIVRLYTRIWLALLRYAGFMRELPPVGRPIDGPCVVVANHPGRFDVLYLLRDVPCLTVLAAYKLTKWLPFAPFVRLAGYVLSPGGREDSPLRSVQEAVDRLRAGYKFQLFPEGRRSPKHDLLPFKAGAFKIAALAGVPIQPVLIRNVPPFMPREDAWYFPERSPSVLQFEFWEPLPPPAPGTERQVARALEARYRAALGLGDTTKNGNT